MKASDHKSIYIHIYNTYSKLINTSKQTNKVSLSDCHVTFINVTILVSQFGKDFQCPKSTFSYFITITHLQILRMSSLDWNDFGISGYDGSTAPEGNIEPAPDMNSSSYWALSWCTSPQRLKGQLTIKLRQVNRLMLNIHKFNISNTEELFRFCIQNTKKLLLWENQSVEHFIQKTTKGNSMHWQGFVII